MAVTEAAYLALVAAIRQESADGLSGLAAGIMAAGYLGIADDSRGFARIFGVAHALAIRAITELAVVRGLVDITARDPRTQCLAFALSEKGADFLARLPASKGETGTTPASGAIDGFLGN